METKEALNLEGKVVVITGKLTIGTRADLEEFIRESGGVARSSVTSKTELLIYGEKAGGKLDQARTMEIETISEADFYERCGFDGPPALELDGKVVVITGKLIVGTRKEIEGFVKDNGGVTRSAVTSKTDLLIYGEKAGGKLDQARTMEIETISEADFYERCGLA